MAATVLLFVGTQTSRWHDERPATRSQSIAYVTPIGVRKDVDFSDGTRIKLNTASRLRASVTRAHREVWLAVLEGRVRVDAASRASEFRPTVVAAGDIAFVQGAATLLMPRSPEAVESALAWRSGMLEYDRTQLSDVVADFNRYNVRQMVVTDPKTARIRIGGMFPSSDIDAFVRLLHDAYGLKVVESEKEIRISSGS